jgi:hypothetical protein
VRAGGAGNGIMMFSQRSIGSSSSESPSTTPQAMFVQQRLRLRLQQQTPLD